MPGPAGKRIALLRGVNVSGKHKLPMAELRATMESAGYGSVRTYIQSGNIVYMPPGRSTVDEDAAAIADLIAEHFGFRPAVMVLEAGDVARHLAASPFADEDPSKAFCVFYRGEVALLGELDRHATRGERWEITDGVVHLHCPNGIGRSKLGERFAGSRAGVEMTTRNLRTVAALVELARAAP